MMCVNQAMLQVGLPFLTEKPPVIVDWLPWNHVFGGLHNFNMMLANGGSLYIDDGKPVKALFDRTLENLSLKTGSLCFNVPVGFGILLAALQKDADLLSCLGPLAADLVITGADRTRIGVMVFPYKAALEAGGYAPKETDGALCCSLLLGDIRRRLTARISANKTLPQ